MDAIAPQLHIVRASQVTPLPRACSCCQAALSWLTVPADSSGVCWPKSAVRASPKSPVAFPLRYSHGSRSSIVFVRRRYGGRIEEVKRMGPVRSRVRNSATSISMACVNNWCAPWRKTSVRASRTAPETPGFFSATPVSLFVRRSHSLQQVDDLGRPSRIRRPFLSGHTQLSIIARSGQSAGNGFRSVSNMRRGCYNAARGGGLCS